MDGKRNFAQGLCLLFCLYVLMAVTVMRVAASPTASVYRRVSLPDAAEKVIALTFDDGPHPRYTPEILDILKEEGVLATFFAIGANLELYGKCTVRAAKEGHEIGNHTFTHPHMQSISEEALQSEILKTDELLLSLTGKRSNLFRPPEGACSEGMRQQLMHLGRNVILWSVDTRDWAGTPCEEMVEHVLKNVRSGDIILFHDYICRPKSQTPEAIRRLIPALKKQGYRFLTVSELIERQSQLSDEAERALPSAASSEASACS